MIQKCIQCELLGDFFQYSNIIILKSDCELHTLVQNLKSGDATFLNTDIDAAVYYHILRVKRTRAILPDQFSVLQKIAQ